MTHPKLLPCPFCGDENPRFERMGTPRQSCIVVCDECGCRHESSDEGDMSGSSWNYRAAAPSPAISGMEGVDAFQARVDPWMQSCFGPAIAADTVERNHRFLEEALELVQALRCTSSEAHQLVDYVFGRPVGEPAQEVGGVMVTLAALCLAADLDMHGAGETELARIMVPEVLAKIRAKQAAKPKHSPPTVARPSQDILSLMPEVLAALRSDGMNVSLVKDVEKALTASSLGIDAHDVTCSLCAGSGTAFRLSDNSPDAHDQEHECGKCDGSGVIDSPVKQPAVPVGHGNPTGEQLYAMVTGRFRSGSFPWDMVADSSKAAWCAAAADLLLSPDTILDKYSLPNPPTVGGRPHYSPQKPVDEVLAHIDSAFKNAMTTYGLLVRALRRVADTTLMDMATCLEISPSQLSGTETGRKSPDISQIERTASFFQNRGIEIDASALRMAARRKP